MKFNRARSLFHLSAEKQPEPGVRQLVLRQTKANNAAKIDPIGLRVLYGDGSIRFERGEVDAPELERLVRPLSERMRSLLGASGAMTVAQIAAELGTDAAQVRVTLKRDKDSGRNRFRRLGVGGERVGLAF